MSFQQGNWRCHVLVQAMFQDSNKLGIGVTAVWQIVGRFAEAVCAELGDEIKWPSGEDLTQAIRASEAYEGLQNCVGAIDCTHINITGPRARLGTGDPSSTASIITASCCRQWWISTAVLSTSRAGGLAPCTT